MTNKMEIKAIMEKIESSKEFGEIPSYSVEAGRKYLYVCKNNGQFHKGNAPHGGGWATFIGKFSVDEARVFFGIEEE